LGFSHDQKWNGHVKGEIAKVPITEEKAWGMLKELRADKLKYAKIGIPI